MKLMFFYHLIDYVRIVRCVLEEALSELLSEEPNGNIIYFLGV